MEKNPPFPSPLMMMKRIRGESDVETGQIASMLKALTNRDMDKLLIGPTRSPRRPNPTRPKADERLNIASNTDATLPEIPMDFA